MVDENKKNPPEAAFLGMPKKVTELVKNESDRGAILILSAYLEEILGLLLQSICVTEKHGQKLLEFNSPAGDFNSKRVLCTALGLISDDEDKALKIIQNIRNKAAHFDRKDRGFDVLFDSEPTVNQIIELSKVLNTKLSSKDSSAVKEQFNSNCRLLSTKLYVRLPRVRRMIQPKSNKDEAAVIRKKLKGTEVGKALENMRDEAKKGNLDKLNEMIGLIGQLAGSSKNSQQKT